MLKTPATSTQTERHAIRSAAAIALFLAACGSAGPNFFQAHVATPSEPGFSYENLNFGNTTGCRAEAKYKAEHIWRIECLYSVGNDPKDLENASRADEAVSSGVNEYARLVCQKDGFADAQVVQVDKESLAVSQTPDNMGARMAQKVIRAKCTK